MARHIPIVGEEGYVAVPADELTEHEISTASAHLNAIGNLLSAETTSEEADAILALAELEGVVIHGITLVTDPEAVRQLDLDDRMPETFYLDAP